MTNESGIDQETLAQVNARLKLRLAEQRRDAPSKLPENTQSASDLFRTYLKVPVSGEDKARWERLDNLETDRKRRELLACSGIPLRHRKPIDINASPEGWRNAHESVMGLLGSGCLVALMGARGTGKTQIAARAVATVCYSLKPCKYTTAAMLCVSIRDSYKKKDDTETAAIQRFVDPALLVIDEVQVRGDTEFEDRVLTLVVDARYNANRDTLLIANLAPEDMAKSLGSSICDRIRETGGFITCNWESFRDGQT